MSIFSPISVILRDAYQTSEEIVDSNATVFFVLNLLVNLPSVYLLESGNSQGEGMSIWFKRAAVATMVGQWGRYMAVIIYPEAFWLTIFPSAIIAFG